MRSALWKLLCVFSFVFSGQNAQAILPVSNDGVDEEQDETIEHSCKALMELEVKNGLSFVDQLVGRIVHDIVSSVSDEPLSYCEIMTAGVVEKDPVEK